LEEHFVLPPQMQEKKLRPSKSPPPLQPQLLLRCTAK
jgi:hypothetical protein